MEIKDKPNSMGVRQWIIKKIAMEQMIPEIVIRQVIAHQFDSAHEALNEHNSLEISGFGKFYYNTKKADKEIEKLLSQEANFQRIYNEATTEKKRTTYRKKLEYAQQQLKELLLKKERYEQSE